MPGLNPASTRRQRFDEGVRGVVKQRGSTGRAFLFGLIVGLVLGAVLALIFGQPSEAPGEENFAGVVRRRYGEALEQGKDAYERAKGEVLARYSRAKAGDFSAE
jgi:hypothetical protein